MINYFFGTNYFFFGTVLTKVGGIFVICIETRFRRNPAQLIHSPAFVTLSFCTFNLNLFRCSAGTYNLMKCPDTEIKLINTQKRGR
jgi:hypothetical protein